MIGSLMMRVSVVVLLVGMLAGIAMGIRAGFRRSAPAHAHLNLVGGVLLFLFGLYYRLVPAAGAMRAGQSAGLAPHRRQRSCFRPALPIVILKGPAFIAAPIVGSLIVVAAMALFAVIVFRTSRAIRVRPSGTRPSLFKPNRGIVRGTDSLRPSSRANT